jgi:CheY-like chemotaxis protein
MPTDNSGTATTMTDAERGILIVEDDVDVREALAVFLAGEGYKVVEAGHGAEALDQLRSAVPFCLILLDLFMPVMDGWTFRAEQLRDAALATIPVIVISADASAVRRGRELGAVASMVKPIDFDALLKHVDEYC